MAERRRRTFVVSGRATARSGTSAWWWAWPLLAGCVTLLSFHAVGARFFDHYTLDLGSTVGPTPRFKRFLELWGAFGTIASILWAVGFARLAATGQRAGRLGAWWDASADRLWLLAGACAGFVVPAALRILLLHGAPLTDDESAYRFTAELLASGRLWVGSPPLKLFFDRVFMINDGHLYGQYFVGWSALMVPGVWLDVPGFMNALYAALTVPALFLVLRRLAGGRWAKAGVLVYLFAPMLMVGAATELSHTSCLMALAWMTLSLLRSRDVDAPWWSDAGVAFGFGLALFIRPTSALGIGLPLLVYWGVGLRSQPREQRRLRLTAFLLPAVLMASLFLAVNKVQTGSATTVAYQRFLSYIRENGYRFSGLDYLNEGELKLLRLDFSLLTVLGRAGIALFRLNFDLFGWPCSLLFVLLAGFGGFTTVLWMSLLSFFCVHLYLFDSGIDSFGPVHYFETAWPLLLLTVLGLRRACENSTGPTALPAAAAPTRAGVPATFLPPALLAALVAASLGGYLPVRFRALAQMAEAINTPREALRQAGLHHAVVFVPHPYVALCRSWPNEHFVNWWPNNDPDLRNDVLWANHISVEQDRRLMARFSDRRAYVMHWTPGCTVEFLALDGLAPGSIPDGFIGGTGQGPS